MGKQELLGMQTLEKQDWTEFSRRNTVYNAKFNVKLRLEHGCAIEYTYFQWVVFHCKQPNATRYANTHKARLDRGFMAK